MAKNGWDIYITTYFNYNKIEQIVVLSLWNKSSFLYFTQIDMDIED